MLVTGSVTEPILCMIRHKLDHWVPPAEGSRGAKDPLPEAIKSHSQSE